MRPLPNWTNNYILDRLDPLYQEFQLQIWKKSVDRKESMKDLQKKKADSKFMCNEKLKAYTEYSDLG